MYTLSHSRFLGILALSAIFVGAASAQNSPSRKTLVVNGRTVDRAVVQIDGHSYVDVDTFARIMNAQVTFESGRVILNVPLTETAAMPERTAPGLSKDFARAGVAQLAEMREGRDCNRDPVGSGRGHLARTLVA
jgi:hypothetical protein